MSAALWWYNWIHLVWEYRRVSVFLIKNLHKQELKKQFSFLYCVVVIKRGFTQIQTWVVTVNFVCISVIICLVWTQNTRLYFSLWLINIRNILLLIQWIWYYNRKGLRLIKPSLLEAKPDHSSQQYNISIIGLLHHIKLIRTLMLNIKFIQYKYSWIWWQDCGVQVWFILVIWWKVKFNIKTKMAYVQYYLGNAFILFYLWYLLSNPYFIGP